MQQPMNTNPVQVVVFAQPALIDNESNYRNMKTGLARKLVRLGVSQVIIGVLCIIFQGIAVGIFARTRYYNGFPGLDFIGHGFWTGLMFLITGPFGIAGGIRRNRCQVVTFNVLSILSSVFAVSLMGIAIPGAIIYAGKRYCDYIYYNTTPSSYINYYSRSGYYDCHTRGTDKTGMAMEAMMAILALIEVIIAIRSSVICCKIGACCCKCGGSCCCPPSPPQNHQFLMTEQHFPGQQQFIIANQQQSGSNLQPQMFIANQPSTFVPNSQQLMFSLSPQQPIINLAPGQQMVQYNHQQQHPPRYSQLASTYAAFSPAPGDQGSFSGFNVGIQNAVVAPEQPEIHDHTAATDDDVPILDIEEN